MSDLRDGWAIEAYPVHNGWEFQAFFVDKEEAEAWLKVFEEDYPNMDARLSKKKAVIVE